MADRAVNAGYNMSGTVEALMAGYVCSEQAREQSEDDQLENVINALNERHKRSGFLSDEFSSLDTTSVALIALSVDIDD
ncbi:MAG TPA: type II toxin-antitoxin system CcdA family antitoxin [Rhodopila sp.]|nr:type II toxin-antitoxin system CcdA family antitoxin [Rhodopila sp.]